MEPRIHAEDTCVTDMWAHAHMGRYILLDRVGQGGMGVVYRAHDPHLQRHVAVKLLRAQGGAQSQAARLLREAQAMARLSHPAVVQVYDAGVADGQVFIAMEYVDGTTLLRWLHDQPHTWQEALHRFLAAGHGLAAAHAAGVVHRDFKPGNVLLSQSGRVVVGDFGLARPIEAHRVMPHDSVSAARGDRSGEETGGPARPTGLVDGRRPSSCAELASVTLTITGPVLGTPKYMAPEQRDAGLVDARADQFSFCVALAEALYLAGAPDRLFDVLGRGLETDPAQRFATMDELLAALEWARMEPAPVSTPRRWGRARTYLAGAVALAAVAWIARGAVGGVAPASRAAAAQEPAAAAIETLSPREVRALEVARTAAARKDDAPEATVQALDHTPALDQPRAPDQHRALDHHQSLAQTPGHEPAAGPRADRSATAPHRRSATRHRARPARSRRPAGADRTRRPGSASRRHSPEKEDPDGLIRDLWTSS